MCKQRIDFGPHLGFGLLAQCLQMHQLYKKGAIDILISTFNLKLTLIFLITNLVW